MRVVPNELIRAFEKFAKDNAEREAAIQKAIESSYIASQSEPLKRFVNQQEKWLKQHQKLIEKPSYIREIERQQMALSYIQESYPDLIQVHAISNGGALLSTKDNLRETRIENSGNVALVRAFLPLVSAAECFEFVNYLSEFPYLGYKHKTGKDIYKCIDNQRRDPISKVSVFRVRLSTDKKTMPYVKSEMFEPMYTVPPQSRFASTGHNPLYLAGDLETAKIETGVTEKSRYTWMEVELVNDFNLLNVTDEKIPVFDYCHKKSTKSGAVLTTEYLMPNFISDCAKDLGFDGLVFNSVHSDTVKNYVIFGAGKKDFRVIDIQGVGYDAE